MSDIVERLRAWVTYSDGEKYGKRLRNPNGPEAADEIEQLKKVVEQCRDRFAEYVVAHTIKDTPEGMMKAERNMEMVRLCGRALGLLETDGEREKSVKTTA